MRGYDLHRHAEDELGSAWPMGISSVYGALKRLEQAGQIEAILDWLQEYRGNAAP